MWIFPQSKTAQFLFSSKDTRRVRHGRASTTEGFAKVLNASVGGNLVINRQDLFFFLQTSGHKLDFKSLNSDFIIYISGLYCLFPSSLHFSHSVVVNR